MTTLRLITLSLAGLVAAGCASKPKPQPLSDQEVAAREAEAILDAPVDRPKRAERKSTLDAMMLLLPETPSEPSKELDGDDADWKGAKFRTFNKKGDVDKGEEFWTGNKDAAMRVGVDADEGFVYFFVEVTDDTVVQSEMGEEPTDGVIIWLRDPGLDSIAKALPSNVGLDEYVDAETAVVVHPNGRVEAWTDDRPDFNEIMLHEVKKTSKGYTVEIAFKLEAFEEISAIPLEDMAFRVELLDGDERDRRGWQSRLSTLPDDGSDAPRFSSFDIAGLLPHIEVGTPPPRTNAIGRWRVDGGKWNFASFEVVPRVWQSLDDMSAFEKALLDSDSLGEVCQTSRHDIRLIEAYQSTGGGFRTGLVMCGQRSGKRGCASDAESRVFLVDLRPETDGEETRWFVDQSIDVFQQPLTQCALDPIRGENFYSHLSLYPLDVLASTVWIVGWTRTLTEPGLDEEAYGITMLNSKYNAPHLGTTVTRMRSSDSEERTLSDSSVYLTYVDDDQDVDICQVEELVEQACSGVDRGCRTYEKGKTILTHIQMWSKKKKRFERYELSKHPGCNSQFDFSDAEGYLVLQLKDRVGLLPSPRTNDGTEDDDKLDLF